MRLGKNRRLRVVLVICAALPWLTGCGVKSGYNKLDWWISALVDDYVTLNSEQRSLFRRQLKEQLSWHRQEQLPRYACWIEHLRTDLADGLTHAAVEGHDAQLRNHWRLLMRRVAPDFTLLLATASDAQLDELRTNVERKTAEYKSKYLDLPLAERREHRSERMKMRLKRWIGPLTAVQEQAIDAWSGHLESSGANRLAYRQQWSAFFAELGAARNDSQRLGHRVERILVDPQTDQSPEYRNRREENRSATKNLLIQIDALLQTRQRVHLQEQLAELSRDFAELSGVPFHRLNCVRPMVETG